MKLTLLFCLAGAANGWSVCSPKRIIRRSIEKGIKKGLIAGAAAGGAAVVAGTAATAAGAVGAAVVFNQINNRDVFEPAPGSMSDRVVLVTGGTSGLGLETAKRLAASGATVVLTSRTEAKGEAAVASVKEYLTGKAIEASGVYSLVLDLDDLSNVKDFSDSYKQLQLGDISVLINNAGVMALPDRELTVDGYERTFQSNHLGHFVLTAGLFPYFSRQGTKVINVSSSASNFAAPGLDLNNLNGEESYGAWSAYGISKLANILFTNELQRKADAAGLDWLTTVSLHPGVVNTDLWRYLVGPEKLEQLKSGDGFSLESAALSATSLFTKTPEQGASTQIFLAVDGTVVKGAFYDDLKEKKNLPPFATDEDKARLLWDASEELVGVRFDLNVADVTLADDKSLVADELDPSAAQEASMEETAGGGEDEESEEEGEDGQEA